MAMPLPLVVHVFVVAVYWLGIAADSEACPVAVQYEASVVQTNDQVDLPFFTATISLTLAANASIVPEWSLEWTFAAGEVMQGTPTISGEPLEVHSPPNSSRVAVSATTDNATLLPDSPVVMSFLGARQPATALAAVQPPLRIAPLSSVSLDGARCEQLPTQGQQQQQQLSLRPPNMSALQVEYTPVQYNLTDPAAREVAARRTDMLIRLRNVGNTTFVLDRVVLRYWLAGPATGADVLTATCLNATTGCSTVAVSIQPGIASRASGARHVLTAALVPEAGSLSPGGVLGLVPSAANEVWELLLRVQAAQLPLDATSDYSFLATRQAGQGGGAVVARYVEPNPRITATLDGWTLWGTPPTAVGSAAYSPAAQPPPMLVCSSLQRSAGSEAARSEREPLRVAPQPLREVCTLLVIYCCPLLDDAEAPAAADSSLALSSRVPPSPPTTPTTNNNNNSSSSNIVAVAVAVGITAGVLLMIGVLAVVCMRRRRQREASKSGKQPPSHIKHDEQAPAWQRAAPSCSSSTNTSTASDWRQSDMGAYGHAPPPRIGALPRSSSWADGSIPASTPCHTPPLPSLLPPDVVLDVDFDAEVAPYLGRCLGSGAFGVVHEATWRGRPVAVKLLASPQASTADANRALRTLRREVELRAACTSPRLVRVYAACLADARRSCVVMELVEGGCLARRIHNRQQPPLTYLEVLHIAQDVAQGLADLHPLVVHRDLKPQNILLDASGRAKIADLGLGRAKGPLDAYLAHTSLQEAGTPLYMAPEDMDGGGRVSEKVDVYALGIILNECCTRRVPWAECDHFFQVVVRVAVLQERPPMDPRTPPPLKQLIQRCWAHDPRARPSCAEVARMAELLIAQQRGQID